MVQQNELPEDRIAIIYNGIDLGPYQYHDNHNTLKNELNIKDYVPLVGMVATMKFEIKGHRFFIEASKKVITKFPNVQFVLVGDGPLRKQFENMAEELGVKQNLHFLGKKHGIPHILSSLDISVLCSTSEGFSNVILESMAAGKPVVASNVGGSPEMVIDGQTGYLVPSADSDALAKAIMKLLNDPIKAKDMGVWGKRMVEEKFSIEKMVKSYEGIYQSLYAEAYP
jgi:glycosyltransferase involved in cell wall biosynthesis